MRIDAVRIDAAVLCGSAAGSADGIASAVAGAVLNRHPNLVDFNQSGSARLTPRHDLDRSRVRLLS
ncbi:hypothetical protein Raf01_83170 [Rugosimonospora africana]|uniref:Uncharacterized protein n=1 Tax=Rugosimonospora africana TaxID=556532 RepID=A0A8J3QZC0_9ACTN|nr:hypothetical protein Raf01_83170 [Rugosimonospora africana]